MDEKREIARGLNLRRPISLNGMPTLIVIIGFMVSLILIAGITGLNLDFRHNLVSVTTSDDVYLHIEQTTSVGILST